LSTYWKSNPYLDSHFTGQPDASHPQWMMVDLDEALPVDTVRVAWGAPYATQFRVQNWTGNDAVFPIQAGVTWRDFPMGTFTGIGGTQTVRVAASPIQVQFVRVLMTADSNTAVPGSRDIRDRLGYAVRELSVGFTDEDGFNDQMDHKPSQDQTTVFTSSTDPWHRASDIDRHYEHASFERVYASGLTNGLPMMVPVPVLYGVPEDAAALVRYLRSRGFPVNRIEMVSVGRPSAPWAFLQMAYTKEEAGQQDPAIQAFQTVCKKFPKDAHAGIAHAHLQQKYKISVTLGGAAEE